MSEKITLQMIFDKAWQAFVVERKPPAHVDGQCFYLTHSGRRCAIGLALPDEVASQLVGFQTPFSYLVRMCEYLFDASVVTADPNTLDDLQDLLHDQLIDRASGNWRFSCLRESYIEVAEEYNFTIPGEHDE